MHISQLFKSRFSLPGSTPFIAAGLILGIWLAFTPAGLLGKADAIAYAICHRIASHSFFLGDRQLPLCARCTGMYLGAFLGLVYTMQGSRRGGMPNLKTSLLLGICFVAFAVDGSNSYLQFYPFFSPLYKTENWMRLITGTGMGIGMAAILSPVFNQTVWQDWQDKPILYSWKQMGILALLAGGIDLAVLSQNPLLLFPLALIGSATVVILLGMIYTIVWILVLKKENVFQNLNQVTGYLVAGFATALLQISIMDLGRYIFTGTWAGFFSG
ncbi:MAG: DUF2085 domain-containing protein [Anaerolineaceae bacterium]|nr:DUF2085 domain-containing protein [Anaerolineaceae bacterium]